MIVIIGESASGKSTLQKMFIEKNPKYKKVITYTTRPIRDGEMDGIDYHFVSYDHFKELVNNKFFAEYNQYRGWLYGTAKEDCMNNNAVAVFNPPGMRAIKKLGIPTLTVYLYVDRRSRLIKLLERGDNVDESYRRNLSDEGQFNSVENEVDYVIDNTEYHLDKYDVLACLGSIVNEANKNGN